MQLLLIRHAESTWNATGRIQGWADPPLSMKGRKQARLLARRLSNDGMPDALYSSTSRRAQETAQLIGAELALEAHPDDRLREESVGDFEGLTSADVKELYPDFWRRWREGPLRPPIPGGEDIETFHDRVVEAMDEIVAAHGPDERAVIVSHGGTFSVYLLHLIGADVHRQTPFWFENASLSVVTLGRGRPRITTLNDTCHLKGLV